MELENYRKAEKIVESINAMDKFLNLLESNTIVELLVATKFSTSNRAEMVLYKDSKLREKFIEAVQEELDTLKKEFEEL